MPTATPAATAVASESPTPTPTPEPTRPALAELVLTTEGLGSLLVGEVPVEGTPVSMVELVENYCALGSSESDPSFDRWAPLAGYESSEAVYGGGLAFGLGVDLSTTVLRRIDVFTPEIPTDAGIRMFSSRAEVAAAYAGIVPFEAILTDVYQVTGTSGILHIEVSSNARVADYWPADEIDTVIALRVVSPGTSAFSVAATDNVPPFCS